MMLSYDGRAVLIKIILQSTTVHFITSAAAPYHNLSNGKAIAKFFWSDTEGKKRYHWMS